MEHCDDRDDGVLAGTAPRWDSCAFEAVVQAHEVALFAYLCRITGRRDLAEDLLQDTFLRAWRGIEQLEQPEKLKAWLFQIARNCARDWLRQISTRPREFTAAAEPALADRGNPEALYRAEELRDQVAFFLRSLPPEQRDVFLLRMESDLSFREIAEMTGVNLSTLLSRMHYTVKKLVAFLGEAR